MMYNLGVYKHTIVTVAERLKRDISLKKNGTKGYIRGSLLWGNLNFFTVIRRVPDIRSIIVNLDRYHTTNRPAARVNENGPVTGGWWLSY